MSTILDALKKSEQERKLNKLPTLSDMPVPQEPSKWPLVLGVVLCVLALTLLLITVFWWGQGSVQSSAQQADSMSPVTVSQLDQQGSKNNANGFLVDDVVVNVISFSEDIDQRFAMVNGKMVREGEYVRGGLKVEKILMDSVVLNVRGRQITLEP